MTHYDPLSQLGSLGYSCAVKKFVIIDGNALIHRCYHAVPKTLRSPTGELTNAVFGFTGILLGILEYEHPDYLPWPGT